MTSPVSPAIRRRRIAIIALGITLAIVFVVGTHLGGGERWKTLVENLSQPLLLACFALLPLTGFPLTLLLLAIGARFGIINGLWLTAAATAVHLFLSYPIAKWVRRPVTSLLAKAGWTLPQLDRRTAWPFSVWVALAPGLSYTLKNYAAPLAGASFTVYFASFFPIHMATSMIGLMLGGATMHLSWSVGAGIALYALVVALVTHWLAIRLKEHHRQLAKENEALPQEIPSTQA